MTKSVVLYGEAFETLRKLADNSVDAVVCDPPYSLSFMSKDWDRHGSPKEFQAWCELWAREALRIAKPGGFLLAAGSSRTHHRLTSGIEDAGWEIRDCITWLYAQGFQKGLNVTKALRSLPACTCDVDGHAGAGAVDRDATPIADAGSATLGTGKLHALECTACGGVRREAIPEGLGTALKPAAEFWTVARKPLAEKTVAKNLLEYGTGALNIDGCRVGTDEAAGDPGRWPSNIILDEEAGAALDEQTGELKSGANPTRRNSDKFRLAYGDFEGQRECEPARGANSGGASRFFYCSKSSTRERNEGLPEGMKNTHATVKPLALMRYLVRLVTPPEGVVLDMFCGSGTTGCAAALEGMSFIGIDNEEGSVEIARARIAYWRAGR